MSVDLATVPEADVLAAGAVLWRRSGPGVEIALVHRPRYDDWSLPKGKLDKGETLAAAAVREVHEETGFAARLGSLLGDIRYTVEEGRKLVRYWAAEALPSGPGFAPNDETDELRWVDPDAALGLLSYDHDLDVVRDFAAVGVPTSVLVVVRHAKAGSRSQWEGDDALRPLSAPGREQAQQLAELLPLFGPDRIATAGNVRCRQTVEPLAELLADRLERTPDGELLRDEPLLSEDHYWDDETAGLARMRDLAAQPGVTVLCSQGGVIPAVVGELVRQASRPLGVDPDDVPSKKASTWVLAFRDGELRSADYYARPGD